tara:strand:- start:73 stop:228 length:156 start_codon:yes stop_codon:yes gene_type:complete
MKQVSEEVQRLLSRVDPSFNETAQIKQVLARLEATLSRQENQRVKEKSRNI